MLPPFDIAGGLPLAAARGLSVAGLLSVFGALLARVAVAPPALAGFERPWRRLTWGSLLLAVAATGVWVWLVAGTLADTPAIGDIAATLPIVLGQTLFGHVVLIRLGVLAAVAATLRLRAQRLAAVLAAVAAGLQSLHSHAFSMDGVGWLLGSDLLHLLAAGAWLGGLLPLLLVVRIAPPEAAARACRRFSWLGGACVLVLAGTAFFQFWVLIGGLPELIGTAYGFVALLKIALFLALLGFAAANHFRLAPALSAEPTARARLGRSIALETAFGLLIVLAAGVLTSLPPSMHGQPVWPFPLRPSLVTVREDADFRREVIAAGLALAGAAALLLAAALARHRARWLAVAAAAAIAWFAAPHLDLLFVQAYPTSYQHSPTGFAASAIVRGAALYPRHCAACHGAEGHGDGAAAKTLPEPPADLTAAHLWMHSDGELIWWLSHGIEAPEGGMAMPGFAGVLPERDLWDLIDYIRAHNAGLVQARTGQWSPPLRAPGLQAVCAGGATVALDDMRGHVIRLVMGAPPSGAGETGITTIAASSDPASHPGPSLCIASDEAIVRAYAIVAGALPNEIMGAQFLIDAEGWLRVLQRPGAAPGWDDPQTLGRAVAAIRAHPIGGPDGNNPPMQMRM